MLKVFIALFVNTALVTLLVNADFGRAGDFLPSFILNGNFKDFTRSWYTNVGATITLTMLISIGSPHLVTLLIVCPLKALKRKYCWKKHKTQHELNTAFLGAEFDMATKASQITNVIFTCFLYSGGMPLLNAVCCLTLLCVYWTDKYLLLRFYRRPPYYSEKINAKIVEMMPLAVFFHACFSFYMYGTETIFPRGFSLGEDGLEADTERIGDRAATASGIG